MKRRLYVTMALVALSLCGMAAACAVLQGSREAVVFTVSTLYGDPAWADGLAVECRATYLDHPDWTSSLRFHDGQFDASTRYRYWQKGIRYDRIASPPSLEMHWDFEHPNRENMRDTGLTRAFLELLDETEPGTEGQNVIRLGDYYEFYPLQFHLSFPDGSEWHMTQFDSWTLEYRQTEYRPQVIYDRLAEFFRIPVLENEYLSIGVRKNPDGSMGMTSSGDAASENEAVDEYRPVCSASFAGDAWYFALGSARSTKGTEMDFSRVPGGYGLYRLPYLPGDGMTAWDDVDENGLAMAYALDPETEVLSLDATADHTRLLLGTREGNGYFLSVIQKDGMELLQKLEIGKTRYGVGPVHIYQRDHFLVCDFLGRLTVLEEAEGGVYTVPLRSKTTRAELPETEQMIRLQTPSYQVQDAVCLDWDGKRLATVYYKSHSELHNIIRLNQIKFYVYDKRDRATLIHRDAASGMGIWNETGIPYHGPAP